MNSHHSDETYGEQHARKFAVIKKTIRTQLQDVISYAQQAVTAVAADNLDLYIESFADMRVKIEVLYQHYNSDHAMMTKEHYRLVEEQAARERLVCDVKSKTSLLNLPASKRRR